MMRQIDLEKLLEGNEVLQEMSVDEQELVVVIRISHSDWFDSTKDDIECYGTVATSLYYVMQIRLILRSEQ